MDALRVVTLNIWGRNGDWPERRERLEGGLRALRPDVVALQETVVDARGDQVRELLGDDFDVVHSRRRYRNGTGISLATRLRVTGVDELPFDPSPRDDGFPATVLVAGLEVPGLEAPVHVANHFPSWKPQQELEREAQAVAAALLLEELDGHVVVTGDFDADPDAASVRFWTGRQSLHGVSVCYRDAWARVRPDEGAPTFTPDENPLVIDPDWPFRQIDHILVRCGEHGGPTLPIRSCERIFDDPPASDHFGLLAELALDGAAQA